MIIVVGGIKGGSGKTTIATNLAVMRSKEHKVLLVDADEQRSSSDWAAQRTDESSGLSTVQITGKTVGSELKKLADASNYQDIIVDVGGRDTTSQRSALTRADLFLVPFKPRSLDIWTLGAVKALIEDVQIVNPNLICMAVINMADFNGSDNVDALEILKEWEVLFCLPGSIGNRKAFGNGASCGLGVGELKPVDTKAVVEMTSLYDAVFSTSVV
jgi:chromosome partitioning protein